MTEKVFYNHLHFFRGFSILLIVAAHCWSMPIFMFNDSQLPEHLNPLFSAIETLFHGSTVYFAMISGILFSLVLKDKSYKSFMKTKFKNVYVPFILISLVYASIWIAMGMVNPPEELSMWQLIAGFSFFLLTGHMSGHLWYIPVIMILFALTPLLNRAVESKQRLWFVLLLMLPLVVSRVWPNFHPGTVVYFIGPYMLGLYIGNNVNEINSWISERFSYLVSIFVIFTAIYFMLIFNDIKYVNWGAYDINSQETVTYILRMSVALLMLKLFYDHVTSVPKVIDLLARYSFAVYFIHVAFIMLMIGLAKQFEMVPESALAMFFFGLITLIVSVVMSIAVSWVIKQLTGRYSRLFIGA